MTNTNGNGGTVRYRLEQLEKNYDRMDTKLERILENHLPHIQEEMIGIKTRINVLSVLVLGVFSSMLALIVAQFFK